MVILVEAEKGDLVPEKNEDAAAAPLACAAAFFFYDDPNLLPA